MHYGLPTQQLTREDAYCVRLVGTHFLHPHDQSPGGVSLKAKKIAQHKFGVAQSENMAFLLERLPHLRAQVFVDAPQVLQSIVCALASPTCHIISCAHEDAVDGVKRDPQQKKKKNCRDVRSTKCTHRRSQLFLLAHPPQAALPWPHS